MNNRRKLLQAFLATSGTLCLGGCQSHGPLRGFSTPPTNSPISDDPGLLIGEDGVMSMQDLENHELSADHFQHLEENVDVADILTEDQEIERYLAKIRNFDADFADDIYLDERGRRLLPPTLTRLERVQTYVGHGNFNLIGYEEMLFYARNYSQIGAFSREEIDFMEEIFFADATGYGFYGNKVNQDLNNIIDSRSVIKIPGSGHYLLRGESLQRYEQLRADIGPQMLLTSGVRNVVKQMHLFLAKTHQSNGNLSKASRSLAPPGYSFHGMGDFDVGKVGMGEKNFTDDFSHTEEFRRMIRLGYIDIRYPDDNRYGVRYEPWHVKIA
jgi:zinc D-Ala-D-Ala carboxypeptidase